MPRYPEGITDERKVAARRRIGVEDDVTVIPAAAVVGSSLYVSCIFVGTIPADQILIDNPMPVACSFPNGLVGSVGTLEVAPTSQLDFRVRKGGAQWGIMRFAAGIKVATFISSSFMPFAVGEIVSVVAPNPADATAATLGFTLTATR